MTFDINSTIFTKIHDLLNFLVDNQVIPQTKQCNINNCTGEQLLIVYNDRNTEALMYRCNKSTCRKKRALLSTNLKITKYLHLMYLLLIGCSYKQLSWAYGVSNATTIKIKSKLRSLYRLYIDDRPIILGGQEIIIEVDETVISRRGLIISPTSTSDTRTDTVWILGAIENTPSRNFFLKRIPDRTIESMTAAFNGILREGSVLYSDGHRSYPQVARNLNLQHSIVNHSVGFVAPDGTHTNNMEGFWAHLKSSMRKEHGVGREMIDLWLAEYTFKRRYVVNATRVEICNLYIDLLKYFFN